jgi:phosphoenolpyruvate-protein phosphotransferase
MMAELILKSPLAGWALPLEEVPDPVFAQRIAGDGVAIDPTGSVLHAPCAGQVSFIGGHSHALNLHTEEGVDILLHVGIDTVSLHGAGFEPLVTDGERVECGQALLRFDLDVIARRAPSAVTPILLVAGGKLVRGNVGTLLAVGDFLMEIAVDGVATEAMDDQVPPPAVTRSFVISFEHGLHARPAALLVAALRPFAATVSLSAAGGLANARSAVALMALGVHRDEVVEISAIGADADAALDAIAEVLASTVATTPSLPPSTQSPSSSSSSSQLPSQSQSPLNTPALTSATGPISHALRGQIASRGLALGPAVFLKRPAIAVAERADDPVREREKLSAAIIQVRAQLSSAAEGQAEAQRSILEAHAELVIDPELSEQARRHIDGGASAGHGWKLAIGNSTRALGMLDDAHMRERIADLRDIEYQVLSVLAGTVARAPAELPDNAILIADELLPSQLLALDRGHLAGIATARGGPTSHVAIIAAALGIPAVVALGPQLLAIEPGSLVVLDAERGFVQPAPDAQEQQRIAIAMATRRQRQAADLARASDSSHTRDGVHVSVCANLGAVEETLAALAKGADGCGLLRSEFLFLQRQSPPDEEEQFEAYRKIRDLLAPRPLTIRTMDIGGDKPIPYLPLPAEENPALGLRGLRTSLARPELLRTQLRAILRLDSPASCRLMLPMVTDVSELRHVREILRECADALGIGDLPKLGAMVETPASALLADQLLLEADFLSIGTNDLSQYVLAMDRGHSLLAAQLDALHPAVLRLIESVAAAGRDCGREVAVCGGLGSDPDAIALLIGLGIREVSAVPDAIPEIKRIIRALDARDCRELARQALNLSDARAVRRLVAEWSEATPLDLETDR